MADNFLENRMADYLAGKRTSTTQHRPRPAVHTSAGTFSLAPCRILIAGGTDKIGTDLVHTFRDADCSKVAFSDVNYIDGNTLSQKEGARFYNIDSNCPALFDKMLHDIVKTWGGIDVFINNSCLTSAEPILSIKQLMTDQNINSQDKYGRIIEIVSSPAYNIVRSETDPIKGITFNTIIAGERQENIQEKCSSIAHLCMFLSLREAGFINGMTITP